MTHRTYAKVAKHRVSIGAISGRRAGEWGKAPKKPGRSKAVPRITGVRRKGDHILISGTDLDKIKIGMFGTPASVPGIWANINGSVKIGGAWYNMPKSGNTIMRVINASANSMVIAPGPKGDKVEGTLSLNAIYEVGSNNTRGNAIDAPNLPATIQFDMIHAPGIAPRKPARKVRIGRRRYSGKKDCGKGQIWDGEKCVDKDKILQPSGSDPLGGLSHKPKRPKRGLRSRVKPGGRRRYSGKTYPYISTSGECGPGEKAQPVIGFGSVLCHSPKMTVKPSRPPKITASAKKPSRKRRRTRI